MSPVRLEPHKTVVFDLDGTLVRGDSVGRLIAKQIRASHFRTLLALPLIPVLPLMRWSIGVSALARALSWIAFTGLKRRAFDELLASHVASMAAQRDRFVIKPSIACLNAHLAAGDRVIVVTGAFEELASAIMRQVLQCDGVEVFGSRVDWGRGGVRVREHCFGTSKLRRLQREGVALPLDVAYTDSAHDWPLLGASRQRHWVGGTQTSIDACRRALGDVEWIPDDLTGRRESRTTR